MEQATPDLSDLEYHVTILYSQAQNFEPDLLPRVFYVALAEVS